MDPIAEHEAQCEQLADQVRTARKAGTLVGLQKSTSNLFRARTSNGKQRIDVRRMQHVLHVDLEHRTADVEGMTTYETLVDATLDHRLLPTVVPQLKTITIGGAISGLGIESSSFRYGLVHETVERMEVLLGDGRIVWCSPSENADLFFGLPNSYGTLGYVLRLTVRLIPAKPYVHMIHSRFVEPASFFSRIHELSEAKEVDYLDGTIFAPDEMYLTEGSFTEEAPQRSDYTYRRIYYQSIRRMKQDWLTALDYIWRWDTDWFWCSKQFYVQQPLVRLLAKPWLNSRSYQRVMRWSQRWIKDNGTTESVIQDVDIPLERAQEFFDFLMKEIPIKPVWVCPFRTGSQAWSLSPLKAEAMYVNFGFWDVIPSAHERGYFNRKIEDKARELHGAKGLYSSSFYSEADFWSIYDREQYRLLKEKYDPQHAFPDLYAKCVRNK